MFDFTFQVLITTVGFGDLQFLTHDLILNFIFPIKVAVNIGLSYNIVSAQLNNSKSLIPSKSSPFFKPEEKHTVFLIILAKCTDGPGFWNYFFTVLYSLLLFCVPPEITALN